MISKEEFLKKVEQELFPLLKTKTGVRDQLKRKSNRNEAFWFVFVIAAMFFSVFVKLGFPFIYRVISFVVLLGIIGFYLWQERKMEREISKEKKFILNWCLKVLDFVPENSKINKYFVKKSKLLSTNLFALEDEFVGRGKYAHFSVSELHFMEGKSKRDVLLLSVPMLHVNSRTILYNISFGKPFTFGFKKVLIPSIQDWDEKNIIVTKDEQEAQRLITPDFVQKLELVKERFKKVALNVFDGDFFGAMEKDLISSKRIDVSFFENQALFAIYLDVDLFETVHLFER